MIKLHAILVCRLDYHHLFLIYSSCCSQSRFPLHSIFKEISLYKCISQLLFCSCKLSTFASYKFCTPFWGILTTYCPSEMQSKLFFTVLLFSAASPIAVAQDSTEDASTTAPPSLNSQQVCSSPPESSFDGYGGIS